MSNSLVENAKPDHSGRTYITFVIDKSGSMGTVKQAALDAFNEQLQEIKDDPKAKNTFVRIVLFSTEIEAGNFVPASEIRPLTSETYITEGVTALNDAIMTAISGTPKLLKSERDASLVVVISDGYENASKTSTGSVRDSIRELEATDLWTFSFFLANRDLREATHTYGFNPNMARTFHTDAAGMQNLAHSTGAMYATYSAARVAGSTAIADFDDHRCGKDGSSE